MALISLSVMMGLAMAARVLRRPGAKRTVAKLHEHVALTALFAVAVHGLSLLGDQWLRPGLTGITVPFALSYRPPFTGAGIIGGYLALLLGPSFYLRRRIGARRWRRVHTMIVATWLLCAAHTLGAGSDAHQLWLRAIVLAPAVPISYLLVLRLLRGEVRQTATPRPVPFRGSAGGPTRSTARDGMGQGSGHGPEGVQPGPAVPRVHAL
jgi:methionine sulfoxide reductase heme-binding subunit